MHRSPQPPFPTAADAAALAAPVLPIVWAAGADPLALTYLSSRWTAHTGLAARASLGARWLDAVHPDDRGPCAAARRGASAAAPLETEYRLRSADGGYRWILDQGEPALDEGGRPAGWHGTLTDIQQIKDMDESRRRSEERLRSLAESGVIGINFADADGTIHYANDEYLRIVGYTRSEVEGRRLGWRDFTPSEWLFADERALAEAGARGACTPYEKQYIRKDGGRVWVLVGFTFVYNQDRSGETIAFVLDISRRKSVERELRDRVEELTTVMDLLPVSVMIAHDPACSVITGNKAAHALFHAPEGGNLSKTPRPGEPAPPFVVHRGGRPARGDELPMQRAAATGQPVAAEELELRFDDGRVVTLQSHAAPLFAPGGEVRGSLGTFVDMTEQKRVAEQLREADRRKDEFLSLLAHELRNPLAPILNALEMLRLSPTPDAVSWARTVMDRQVRQLVRLVDDLLDVARIRTGKIRLRKELSDLAAAVRTAVEACEPAVREAGHTLAVRGMDMPYPVVADPVRLVQVVSNLLSNAARYTPRGGAVDVTLERDGGSAVLRVRDTGVGIPQGMLTRVFELFTQVETEASRAGQGLGIGLSLVKTLVEMHGGEVSAASEGPGRGSELTVRLPLSGEAPPAAAAPGPAPRGAGEGLAIVVVDDNVDAAESLVLLLELGGHRAFAAHDGPSGLRAIDAHEPDLVLLDIGLPGMDGYEVCRVARERRPGLFISALSGWGQEEDRRRSREAGFDAHLVKPVSPEQLAAILAQAAARRGAGDRG